MTRDVVAAAVQSLGTSDVAIYRMVRNALVRQRIRGRVLLDVGCGRGGLWPWVSDRFDRWIGVDVVRHPGLPHDVTFEAVDLDTGRIPMEDGTADVTAAIEVIEHVENPRAFVRELTRAVKPGGWVVVTTPNQRSLLSLVTLVTKGHFAAFGDLDYPAHLTALLEVDLLRIVAEASLVEPIIEYSRQGRVIFTGRHYPSMISRVFPRACSDNLLVMARRPR